MAKEKGSEKKGFVMPHIYVILFVMITLAVIATYIVPAGAYDRETVDGVDMIIPDTFSFVGQTPVSFMDYMTSIPRGVIATIEIIFGIMAIGALFKIVENAGVINLIIDFLTKRFKKKGLLLIPTIMIPLVVFVTITGNIESSLIFLPAVLPLFLKLGFDRIAATATTLVATVVGFSVALAAPANLGTAQTIAELPLYSGIGYRAVVLTVMTVIGIIYVLWYSRKVLNDPSKSLVSNYVDPKEFTREDDEKSEVTTRTKLATAAFVLSFAGMFYGVLVHGWYFTELAGFYLFAGIICGLIAGMGPSKIADSINEGIKNILLGALIVGVARAISISLEDGQILDTVVYGLSLVINMIPDTLVPVIMMVSQGLLNFLIPSGSGQAAATMPIMVGIVDITEMTRQNAVLAFQFGDGFSNIFYPTSGYFMAALVIAKVQYTDWLKFIWPLLVIWYSVGAVFLIIAHLMNWGPF